MAIKNVVVIIDDFSDASRRLWNEGYGIELFDYGVNEYRIDAYDSTGGFVSGPHEVGANYYYGALYLFNPNEPSGLYSDWDYDVDFDFTDEIDFYESSQPGYYIEESYALVDPFFEGGWQHGDIVAKALFEQLDDPSSTYVLAIDWDPDSRLLYSAPMGVDDDLSYLVSGPLDEAGQTPLEQIVDIYINYKSNLWPENEFNLIGYSFSFVSTYLEGYADALFPLFDVDSPIFSFAQNNIRDLDNPDDLYFPSWNELFADIITVGAWNTDVGDFSLIADKDVLYQTDILANGIVEHGGPEVMSLTGELGFGTSYATPRIMAEIVNYYEEFVYPLLNNGTIDNIADAWGQLVDPSTGYSGIVDHILDGISTKVEILFDDSADYIPFRVMTDDITIDSLGDLSWPQILNSDVRELNTDKILDVRLAASENTNQVYVAGEFLPSFENPDADIPELWVTGQIAQGVAADLQVELVIWKDAMEVSRQTINIPSAAVDGVGSFNTKVNIDGLLNGSGDYSVSFDNVWVNDGVSSGAENYVVADLIQVPSDYSYFFLGSDNSEPIDASWYETGRNVFAGDGDDLVMGSPSHEIVHGGDGNDRLYSGGGGALDVLMGGRGDDFIKIGLGGSLADGGSGNDQFHVSNGPLTNFSFPGAELLGVGQTILANGQTVFVVSAGRKFDGSIPVSPGLEGSVPDIILSEATARFSINVNIPGQGGQSVTVGPETMFEGPLQVGGLGFTLVFQVVPTTLSQRFDPADPNTSCTDLIVTAVDDMGNPIPLPAGLEININSVEVGYLGYDGMSWSVLDPVMVENKVGGDSFYTEASVEGFVYDNGAVTKFHYLNDSGNVKYESSGGSEIAGGDGIDTVHIYGDASSYTSWTEPGYTVYEHIQSMDQIRVDAAVENVVFHGISAPVNPADFLDLNYYSVYPSAADGDAVIDVAGTVDLEKLSPNEDYFEAVVSVEKYFTGNSVVSEIIKIRVPLSDVASDGSFAITYEDPNILQGAVNLIGFDYVSSAGAPAIQYIEPFEYRAYGAGPSMGSASNITVNDIQIIFDEEAGEPQLVISGNVNNPLAFAWGAIGLRIGMSDRLSFSLTPDDIQGGEFRYVIDNDQLTNLLQTMEQNGSLPSSAMFDEAGRAEIYVALDSIEVIDTSKATTNEAAFADAPDTNFIYMYGDLVEQNYVNFDDTLSVANEMPIIYSSAGNDRFSGNPFADSLDGVSIGAGDGDDLLRGSAGDDSLYGGAGSDVLVGTSGLDKLFGGANDDLFQIGEIPTGIVNLAMGTGAITAVNSWLDSYGAGSGYIGAVIAHPGPIDENGLTFRAKIVDPFTQNELVVNGNSTGNGLGAVISVTLSDGSVVNIALAISDNATSRASADGFISLDLFILSSPGMPGGLPEGLEVLLTDILVNGNTIALTHEPSAHFVAPDISEIPSDMGSVSQFLYDASDALYGSGNGNEINGGTGKDTVQYFAPRSAYEVSTENGVTTVVHIASGRIDTLTRIETIEFINGTNVEVITLDPFSDYQKIDGGEGDDLILGGAGKSYIVSGGGSDIIRDEGGEDYVVLTGASGTVDVDLGIGDDIIRIAGDFSGSVALSGGQGNDILEIEGGFEGLIRDGQDLVISLGNGDELRIADQFDVEGNVNADTGIGLIRNVYIEDDGSETVSAIALDPVFGEEADYTQIILTAENPRYRGEWDDDRWNPLNIIGHDGDDDVDAGEGDDLIIGNGGDDFLFGLGGDDIIRGGEGDDLIGGDSGTNMLFGGSGDDIYSITFYKEGFYSSVGPDAYGNIDGWTPGGLNTVEDESGFDSLLLEGYLLSDPLGDVKYELNDGALQISIAVEDAYGDLAITEMVRWNWFRLDAHYEEGDASYGMTYDELEAFDLKNIETWPGWNDLDAGSQAFYRQYLDPTLPVSEFLAHINDVANHVYSNVSYNRYTIDPVSYDGNYPLYTSAELANAAREGDGTSQIIYIEDMATGTPIAYYMPNGVENAFFGDLPGDYDFGADYYGVDYVEGYLPQAPMSGDAAMPLSMQMPFLFATSLAYGNVVNLMEADMVGAKQGVVVDDASSIERIIEVADETVFEHIDAKIDELMAGGGGGEQKIVDPSMWLNATWANAELSSGIYSANYLNNLVVSEVNGIVKLTLVINGAGYLFWQGPKENVTHFAFKNATIDVAEVLGWPPEEMNLSQAVKEVIPWAIEEGYFKEYFLDPDGVALGSEQDQMLIADWANVNADNVYRYIDEDGLLRFSEDAVEGGELFSGPNDINFLTLFGGEGDDKLIAADDPTFPPMPDSTGSFIPTIQFLSGGAGDDMFVQSDNGIVAMVGGTGIDRFYVGEGISQTIIYGDEQADAGMGEVIGINTDFGDAVYFDWAFEQDEITRNTDGSIVVQHMGQQAVLHDVEYMFFRDEYGEYKRYDLTEGEIIGREAWTNETLKAQYDALDPSNFTFAVDFNTQVSGNTTDRLILKYNDEEVWSGDRWSVDKLELPQGVMVNVVNVKATDTLTGDVFDPNDFTTDGIDLIFGDDRVNIIDAKGGNDVIFGGGGDDVLIGGDGDDMIFGQDGDDIIRGDGVSADDVAAGYFEADYFDPNEILAGQDLLEGGAGIDDLAGGAGRDALAADSFSNVDIDGDGDTADTLADIAGFNPFEDQDDIV